MYVTICSLSLVLFKQNPKVTSSDQLLPIFSVFMNMVISSSLFNSPLGVLRSRSEDKTIALETAIRHSFTWAINHLFPVTVSSNKS